MQPSQEQEHGSAVALTCTELWPIGECRCGASPELQDTFSLTKETTGTAVGRTGEKGLVQSLAERNSTLSCTGRDLSAAHLPQGVCANEAFYPADIKPGSSRANKKSLPHHISSRSLKPPCPRVNRAHEQAEGGRFLQLPVMAFSLLGNRG